MNPDFLELLGVGLGELQDFGWARCVVPEDRESLVRWRLSVQDGRDWHDRHRIRDAQGVERTFLCRAYVVHDEDGRTIGWTGAHLDVTGQQQAEQARDAVEERFRLATEALDGLIYDRDLRTNTTVRSQGLFTVVGYRPDEAPASTDWWFSRVHPEDLPRLRARAETAFAGGRGYDVEYRMLHRNGEYVHVWEKGRIVRDGEGRAERVVGVTFNITERRQTEERLRELNEKLEQLVAERTAVAEQRASQLRVLATELTQAEQRERRRLANILHDHLQQLLIAAKMQLGVLRDDAGDARLAGPLENVERTLTECIQASRSLTVELSPPILHDRGLTAALHWLARWMRDKQGLNVAIMAHESAEPTAEAVRVLLFEIVRELLLNVVKHASVGEATVELGPLESDRVRIVVSDSGAGFDAGRLAVAGDDSHVGFGLSSIRQRLELLGGSLQLDSAPGRGTRVAIDAPLDQPERSRRHGPASPGEPSPEPEAAAVPGGDALPGRTGRIRVLLADDHKIVREGLVGLLQRETDLEVVGEASDGQMAVELARSLRPDVIIMDVNMPRLNGVEATAGITSEMPAVQVIGLSLHDEEDMAHAMFDAGATAYLAKGGPSGDLIAAIRAARTA